MEAWAIVVAGGSGSRFGRMKQYELLGDRRVVDRALDGARTCCAGSVLVVPMGGPEDKADPVVAEVRRGSADVVVVGGRSRSESVRRGLAAVPSSAEIIVVHDAARPLATIRLWEAVIAAIVAGADGAVPAVAVTDTVKQIQPDGTLVTLDRQTLVAVQTPQAFRAGTLRRAHAGGGEATDDATLVEAIGGVIARVEGEADNLKLTRPADLAVAEILLSSIHWAP
jgi:2-C-methyl-D-erythritol 4-phosphate cytidylyltransferase